MSLDIKSVVKKIVPNEILQIIRLGSKNAYYFKLVKDIQKNASENDIYIFGTAIHKNLGDQLITLSVNKMLKELFPEKKIVEIPTEMYQVYRNKLIKSIPKNSLIIINGGGWMGNVWVKEELLVQDMVVSFSNNNIIIFPQTIYYDKNIEPYEELIDSAREAYKKNPHLMITVREQNSYDFAVQHFPNTKIMLVPDIALYYFDELDSLRTYKKENVVTFCLREDRENVRVNDIIEKIKEVFEKHNLAIGKTSTINEVRVPENKRKKSVIDRLEVFAKSKFIVTDRLHGMIFAYLVGTPCFILENKTKKVSGVYDKWLMGEKIFPLYKEKDIEEIENFIVNNINFESSKLVNSVNFDEMKEAIKIWLKLKD